MAVDTVSLAIAGTGLGLIVISTITSYAAPVSLMLKYRKVPLDVYSDKDGTSTFELTSKFSTSFIRSIVGLFSLAGLGVATALAVLDLQQRDSWFIENWINLAAWVR